MGSPTLRIRLFGELALDLGGAPLEPLGSARAESLLAYLLLHRQAPQPRQRIAFLLWPDSTEPQARTNLRHLLHTLRRALPDPDRFLEAGARTLQWRADAPFWLDVAAFEAATERAKAAAADGGLAPLREAAELYTGDLLQGSYDEWLVRERDRLRQLNGAALERLAALLEARGELAEAILYAERLLRQDPLREESYRLLMRLHDARGDRAGAVRIYHACAATMERELGVGPSAPTRDAYEGLVVPERGLPPTPGQSAAERQGRPADGPPLVGRTREWAQLTALWRAAEGGRAQLVLVTGEPGVGKTRLIEQLRSWCAHRGVGTAEARSYQAEGELAYGPVVAWLRSEAIAGRLARLDRAALGELARLLPELRSAAPDLARPEPLPESEQRQRLFDAIARAVLAPGRPLLLVADDIHWCDRETLQFLHYLLRVRPDARVLVAATARPEELDGGPPLHEPLMGLRALECFTEIAIGRLSREETGALAERLAGGPLTDADATALYGETEGNPLFVVEAMRAGWGSARAKGGWLSPRLQAVVESRLAQLSEPARELVGVAATIGREFTSQVLGRASGAGEDTLVSALDELWRRRIVREQGADGYDFSHDKIREVAYLTLSPARRRRLHLRVAQALEWRHAHDLAPVSGQLAAHYAHAGEVDRAAAWYVRAAEAAQQLHANDEAVRLLSRARDLLGALPESAERDTVELSILTALPAPLGAAEGYASVRLAEVQRRAFELVRAHGLEPAPALLRSLAVAGLSRGDFAGARQAGEELRARGTRDADDVLLVESDYVLGIAAFWQGAFAVARSHFEAAVDRYRPEHRRAHLLQYGQDPKVLCLSRLGNTLWFLGMPNAAVRARDAALELAEEVGHPQSRATALVFAAILSLGAGDVERFREFAALVGGRDRYASRITQVTADAFDGYAEVLDGRLAAGVARIERALDEGVDPRGAEHAPGLRAIIVHLLLAARAATGGARATVAAADRALELSGAARLWESDIRRRRAESLAALGAPVQDVEAELERALDVARRQGARSLELKVAASLLHYRLARGDGDGASEARDLIAAVVAELPAGADAQTSQEFRPTLLATLPTRTRGGLQDGLAERSWNASAPD